MRKFIYIIGLPGSGKSNLIKEKYSSPSWICYDDYRAGSVYSEGGFTKSRNYPFLIHELVKGEKNIAISDIAFCESTILNDAKRIINWWVEKFSIKVEIDYIYFENNPKQCIANISQDEKLRLKRINEFKDNYTIPDDAKVEKIWCGS